MKSQKRNLSASLILGFISVSALARPSEFGTKSLTEVVSSNLKFVESEQIKMSGSIYERGEWPTEIQSTLVPAMVGVGHLIGHDEEASAFTTGSVLNQLAAIYLENPELQTSEAFQRIPSLIDLALPTFERYREGSLYNFYPPKIWKGVRVHQPANMHLIGAWKGFTNVPEDADTTSIVYTSQLLAARIAHQKFQVPDAVLSSMDRNRDENRKPEFYNKFQKRKQTGAFMTWQADEKNPAMPRFWFAPPEAGVRIPFNQNDVDCVVNMNVLRMSALNQTPYLQGREKACAMINDMIRKDEHKSCGIYYPNTFNLAFAIAQAEKAGESCVLPERKRQTAEMILKLQSADGGWDNDQNIWIDRVQSTVFAMTALLQYGDLKNHGVQYSLRFATAFLLRNIKLSSQGDLYWKGELFFTATAIARGLIAWKSNSFTTAAAAAVLLKMRALFPDWKAQDYLDRQQ